MPRPVGILGVFTTRAPASGRTHANVLLSSPYHTMQSILVSFAVPNVSTDPHYVSAAFLSCALLVGEMLVIPLDIFPVIHPRPYSRVRTYSKIVHSTRIPTRCSWRVWLCWRRSSLPFSRNSNARLINALHKAQLDYEVAAHSQALILIR
ncbi:hypothetical protein EI94DRAFT_160885 [Lactarius quietus]|nr:hypothetical protein EI94DRAFT_160885 [Lactarius quietus]